MLPGLRTKLQGRPPVSPWRTDMVSSFFASPRVPLLLAGLMTAIFFKWSSIFVFTLQEHEAAAAASSKSEALSRQLSQIQVRDGHRGSCQNGH